MSPKVAPKAAKAAKPAAKESAKEKAPKKSAKAAAAEKAPLAAAPVEGQVDADELEEQEEQAEAAAASSGGGNAAALAAAATGTTESASFKNFRHHPDMENFYRFIYENDLRHEALAIIDQIGEEKQARRQVKVAKANAH